MLSLDARAVTVAESVAPPSDGRAVVDQLPPFEQLYREHFDFVWRALARLGVPRRDQEDQLQEVFRIVYQTRARYDGQTSPRAWLFGIARNVTRTWRRSVRRKGLFDPLPEVLPDLDGVAPERAAAMREDLQRLSRILGALDPDLRDVYIMTEFLEMTAREIGEALTLSPDTASSRLRRARQEVERRVALLGRRP